VYRRGEADMSCYHYEYELAKRDGCGFRFNAAPQRIVGNGSGVVAAVEVRTSSGTETIPCDMVIVAIGQESGLKLTWAKGQSQSLHRGRLREWRGGDCECGRGGRCGSKEDP